MNTNNRREKIQEKDWLKVYIDNFMYVQRKYKECKEYIFPVYTKRNTENAENTCHAPDSPLVDIVLFGLSLSGFPSRL